VADSELPLSPLNPKSFVESECNLTRQRNCDADGKLLRGSDVHMTLPPLLSADSMSVRIPLAELAMCTKLLLPD
jgi:hypothetical protein